MRLINCERENERAKFNAELDAKIADRESVPWDWADYEAAATMARYYAQEFGETEPVKRVMLECQFDLEDEAFRRGIAATIRRIAT